MTQSMRDAVKGVGGKLSLLLPPCILLSLSLGATVALGNFANHHAFRSRWTPVDEPGSGRAHVD